MQKVLISMILFVVVFGFVLVGKGISVYNNVIYYQTAIEAKQKDNESVFDNMWKKISQTVQVSDKYKQGLKEILESYVSGRSIDDNNLLVNWIHEAVPNFDASVYKEINNTIIAGRDDFVKQQRILLDLSKEYKKYIKIFPNNVYCTLFGIKEINVKIITSNKTEQIFDTQKEEDINII